MLTKLQRFWYFWMALFSNIAAAAISAFCLSRCVATSPGERDALVPGFLGFYQCIALQVLLMLALPWCLCVYPIYEAEANEFGRSLEFGTLVLTLFLFSHPFALLAALSLLGVTIR